MDLIDDFENDILRNAKIQGEDGIENILKYFDTNELRKRLELL